MELYVEGDVICFKKYSTLPEIAQTVETLANQVSDPDALRDLENVKVGDHIKGIKGYAEYYGTEYSS